MTVSLDIVSGAAPDPGRRATTSSIGASLDQAWHALQARATFGLSPFGLPLVAIDWAMHLANSPGSWIEIQRQAVLNAMKFAGAVTSGAAPAAFAVDRNDHRFAHPSWSEPPYCFWAAAFLLTESWALNAVSIPPGVARDHARIMCFAVRQAMDIFSPSNIPLANPEVMVATREQEGTNLWRGMMHLAEDVAARAGQAHHEAPLKPGRDLAITPGQVILRNRLMELIQYAPQTPTVAASPVLIVPAWIMKYYILDLSPKNSLINWLVHQGFTVFAISWKNPDASMRDATLDDYRCEGVLASLDAIGQICGAVPVNACGYCLGGTLLAMTVAAMARDQDTRLGSITLLAAQTDFTEAGELQTFITEDQIAFLSDVMAARGYLESNQMAGAFQILRANDLIWSRAVRRYCLGEEEFSTDMTVWNDDATRMPARMHAEYLKSLFEDNDLAEGRFCAGGQPVTLGDIDAPFFVVGTETDHIAPWQSVYKIALLNDGDLTFVLTSGGHNAGIVSEPGHAKRHYRIANRPRQAHTPSPAMWRDNVAPVPGSWWPAWGAWLAARAGAQVPLPSLGIPGEIIFGDAPGSYIFER
jgi:polyhydroxyalkanoate synthase